MSSESRKIDEGTLDALLYLSRLSPESTNLTTLREQVDQIVGYFDILYLLHEVRKIHKASAAH